MKVPTRWSQVRKAIVAVATVIAEIAGVWVDAPSWFAPVAALAGAILVYLVPNEPMPS